MHSLRTCILVAAYIFCTIAIGAFCGCEQHGSNQQPFGSPPIELKEGWEYRWGDSPVDSDNTPQWTYEGYGSSAWKPVEYSDGIANPPGRDGSKILWLRVKLPDAPLRDPHILIAAVRFACEAYLESKPVYRFKYINVPGQGKFTEDPFHLFPLDYDFQNRMLFFRIYSEDMSFIGLENVACGSHADFVKFLFRDATPWIIFGFLFISTGLIPLILFAMRRREKAYLVFGFLCICIGFWTLGGSRILQYLFNRPRFWHYFLYLFVFLTPVALSAQFEQIFGAGYKSIIRRSWQFFLVYAIAALFLLYAAIVSYQILLLVQMIFYAALAISMLILFATSIRAALRGNYEAKIISAGFAVFCAFAIYDILGGAFKILPWTQNTFYWGMAAFIISLAFVLEHRFRRYAAELERSNVKLKEYSETLEIKVKERTIDLENKNVELISTMKELEETQNQLIMKEKMASLGNLVAGVAHEINTPMGAVHSAADVTARCIEIIKGIMKPDRSMDEKVSNEQFEKAFKMIEENNSIMTTASDRITRIVRSLRTFARLDEAEYKKADIHDGLDSTLALIAHEIKNRITVVKEYGKIPEIACYPNQLNQVFMNILMNAVHAIETEGQIVIRTRSEHDNILIEISDNGSGIPPDHVEKIFNPGFTTKGVGVGTGLGLSISYNIIQKHHGEIKVASEAGVGSTFTIILPVAGTKAV